MKAWQYSGTGKPLELNEVAEPKVGPGEGMDHWKVGDREGLSPMLSDG
jgi:hypothetical protein